MRTLFPCAVALLFAPGIALPAAGSDAADLAVVQRIKTEAFLRSQVMDHLFYLADVHGPRLTNSPGYHAAAAWAIERLREYGLANVQREAWGPFGPGWECTRFEAHLRAPEYAPLIGFALGWSAPTNGPVSGEPVLAVLGSEKDFPRWHGKLRGRMVLTEAPRALPMNPAPPAHRYTAAELHALEQALPPPPPAAPGPAVVNEAARFRGLLNQFLIDEGVAVHVTAGQRGDFGTIHAKSVPSRSGQPPLPPPSIAIAAEQYNRIARLLAGGVPVRMDVNIEASFTPQPANTYNVVAEIPGGSKKDEVVMAGAHLDSWNSGTGAVDDGAGVAVTMEAVRILKSLGFKTDRTIRVAFWAAEEHGLLGSKAWVAAHTAELPRIAAYFNLDAGGGRIRGVYTQENPAALPVLDAWLRPFHDLGAATVSPRADHGSDHEAFDALGVPAFNFIQDPLDSMTRAHHSNMDLYDRAQSGDLMQSAAILASFLYHAANRPDPLPRKSAPSAAAIPSASAPAPEGWCWNTDIAVSGGGYIMNAPQLYLLGDGELVGIFPMDRYVSDAVHKELKFAWYSSRDGGITWAPRATAHPPDFTTLGPSQTPVRALALPDGSLLATGNYGWENFTEADRERLGKQGYYLFDQKDGNAPGVVSVIRRVLMARSIDGGRTWQTGEVPLGFMPHLAIYGNAIVLRDGTYLQPAWGRFDLAKEPRWVSSLALRTADGGRHWDVARIAQATTFDFNETSLAEASNGDVVAVMRTNAQKEIWTAYSTDSGKTWSTPRDSGMRGSTPWIVRAASGELVAIYTRREKQLFPSTGVFASVSRDNGRTWDIAHEATLRDTGTRRVDGYPQAVALADGSVYTVYVTEVSVPARENGQIIRAPSRTAVVGTRFAPSYSGPAVRQFNEP
jgi:carboxypeptidase Q